MTKSTQLGLMNGFAAMFFLTVLYIIDPILLVQGYERFTLLLAAGLILYGAVKQRPTSLTPAHLEDLLQSEKDTNNDFISFGELLQFGFRIFVIGFVLKFIYIYFLFHFYDTNLIELAKIESIQIFKSFQNTATHTQEILDQQLKEYSAQNFGPELTDFLGISIELIIGFIIAFVIAIFFKRDRPNY